MQLADKTGLDPSSADGCVTLGRFPSLSVLCYEFPHLYNRTNSIFTGWFDAFRFTFWLYRLRNSIREGQGLIRGHRADLRERQPHPADPQGRE